MKRRVLALALMMALVSGRAFAQSGERIVFGRTAVGFSYNDQRLAPVTSVPVDRAVWGGLAQPVVFVSDVNGAWNPGVVGIVDDAGNIGIGRFDGNPMPLYSVYDVIAIDGALVPNAFIHRATRRNIESNWTVIEHPSANGNPDAVIVVTPHLGRDTNHPVGVWYTNGRWAIYNEDREPMAESRRFSVLVVDPAETSPVGDIVAVDTMRLQQDLRPSGDQVHEYRLPYRRESMRLLVTHNYRDRGPYQLSPLSVQFDSRSWLLANTTMDPIQDDLMVNVMVFDPAGSRTEGTRFAGSYFPPFRFVAARDQALRSVRSSISVSMTFAHYYQGMEGVVSWINYTGQPVEYYRVASGERITFQTYESHVWFVELVSERSSLSFSFIADERPEQEVILYVER